jgi:mRNA interferase RelE/StbE
MTDRPRYTLEFSPIAARALERLPKNVVSRIRKATDALATDPRPYGCKKLTGQGDKYRLCVGDYRIVYSVEDEELIILVIDLGHRRDIYRSR